MKKLMLMLMVLAMAAPLYAAGEVTFVATDNEDGTCTITFDANDIFDIQPVAMGIDVKVNGSDPCHLITAVSGIDSFFDIFMDAAYEIQSDPCDPCYPYDYGEGDAIADPCGPGTADLPSHNFTVSMGGLGGESGELDSAPDNGTAFVLTAGNTKDPCNPVTGHIKINARRGGVIGNDTEPMVTNLHLPFTITYNITDCMKDTHPGYDLWVELDKPDCWCYSTQCKGNIDGLYEITGTVAVFMGDLPTFLANFGQQFVTTEPGICANLDHLLEITGTVPVFMGDLPIFLANFGQQFIGDCDATHFNFWITP